LTTLKEFDKLFDHKKILVTGMRLFVRQFLDHNDTAHTTVFYSERTE